MNRGWKEIAQICGGFAVACGGLLTLVTLPALELVKYLETFAETHPEPSPELYFNFAIFWVSLISLCFANGLFLFYHANASLNGRPSTLLRLPPFWALAWSLLPLWMVGESLRHSPSFYPFFSLTFMIGAVLPPLAALAWATAGEDGGITWRQFSTVFVLGTSLSPGLILIVVIILSTIFADLYIGLIDAGDFFEIFVLPLTISMVQGLVIPLITLPLLRQAENRRKAFLIGAAIGAGFAGVYNLVYTGSYVNSWGGALALCTLGAGVYPLSIGLVTLAWYQQIHPQPMTAPRVQNKSIRQFPAYQLLGAAWGILTLWNMGSIVQMGFGKAYWGGLNAAEIDLFGLNLNSALLSFLAVVGCGAWLALRGVLHGLAEPQPGENREATQLEALPPERTFAVWALFCLVVALALGLAALRFWGGGR